MSQHQTPKKKLSVGLLTGVAVTALAALIIGCGGGSTDTSMTGTTSMTNATSTATTSTSTATTSTATGTTATSTATTATGSTSGLLPANVIFFADTPDQTNGTPMVNYSYINPNGTGKTAVASLPYNFGAIALNAVNQTKYFSYTASLTSPSYGIYSNTTYSTTNAKVIVAPNTANPYVLASEIQVSPDGSTLYFLAQVGNNEPVIYSVPVGGSIPPTPLDSCADQFSLNPAGNQLVYGKAISSTIQIFTRGIAPTSTPSQITNNNYQSDQPQWNKTGTEICFTAEPPSSNGLDFVFTMKPDGSGVTQVTDTPMQDDNTPSFNTAGTQISFVSISGGSTSTQGLYTVSIGSTPDTNRTLILQDPSILTGTYWTSSSGRGTSKGWGYSNQWRKKSQTNRTPAPASPAALRKAKA